MRKEKITIELSSKDNAAFLYLCQALNKTPGQIIENIFLHNKDVVRNKIKKEKEESKMTESYKQDTLINHLSISLKEQDSLFKDEEIYQVIHDYYKREEDYLKKVGIHELLDRNMNNAGYRFIMWSLQKELSEKKSQNQLSKIEENLFLLLVEDASQKHKFVYSNYLMKQFKNIIDTII